MIRLPETGYLRLSQIIGRNAKTTNSNSRCKTNQEAIPALIPVSKSTWWQGVKDGRFPQSIKLSERVTVWRVEDIRAFIDNTFSSQTTKTVEGSK